MTTIGRETTMFGIWIGQDNDTGQWHVIGKGRSFHGHGVEMIIQDIEDGRI